jgi:hypothetical protein
MKTASKIFPNPIRNLRPMGMKAKLSIKSNVFSVESEIDENERIFFSELNQNCYLEISEYTDQHFALLLQTPNEKRSFDYIPKQFLQLTEEISWL